MSNYKLGDRVVVTNYAPAQNFPELKERILSDMVGRVGTIVDVREPLSHEDFEFGLALQESMGVTGIVSAANEEMYEVEYDEPINAINHDGSPAYSTSEYFTTDELEHAKAA